VPAWPYLPTSIIRQLGQRSISHHPRRNRGEKRLHRVPAALPEHIPTATNKVDVRCTAGEAYSVGLSNGQNWDGNTRRMKSVANNYMSYEIWKDALAESRWGEAGTERWPSANASVNGANLNGTLTQLFTYHAKVLATQPSGSAQPAGTYKDTLRVSVDF
jgi:spore coat protein U-like protein